MNARNNIISYICLLYILCITSAYAYVQYPTPTNDYVNDFADIIEPHDKKRLISQLANIEKQTGIEIVVVTINSKSDYGYQRNDIEGFATDLFNTWGVGHKETNKGAMILVAKSDRQVRVELGLAYGHKLDTQMKQVIDDEMLPYFRTNNYSRAIYEGTQGVTNLLTTKVSFIQFYRWELIISVAAMLCLASGISCMRKGKNGWGWIFFCLVGMLLIALATLVLTKNKSRGGFGGGRSGGGGASGSW